MDAMIKDKAKKPNKSTHKRHIPIVVDIYKETKKKKKDNTDIGIFDDLSQHNESNIHLDLQNKIKGN